MGSTTVCVDVRIDRESTVVEVDDLGGSVTAPHRLNEASLESLERIRRQGGTADSYGQALFDLAFDDDARYGFMSAMRPFQPGRSTGRFRLRLELAASAPALHGVCWESLVDGQVFTRSVASSHKGGFYRRVKVAEPPIEAQGPSRLKMLAAIATPDLGNYSPQLEPVDAARHRAILTDEELGLRDVEFVQAPVSLASLVDRLQEDDLRDCNVLHIAAPGGVDEHGPFILLEGGSRSRPEQLRPRHLEDIAAEEAPDLELVVLAVNHSGDSPPADPDGGFGPRLLGRGPAVVAVQGRLPSDLSYVLVGTLYRRLGADQLALDQAVNLARGELSKLSGVDAERRWAAPNVVLFSSGDEALERFHDPTPRPVGWHAESPGRGRTESPHRGRGEKILRAHKQASQYVWDSRVYSPEGQEWTPRRSKSWLAEITSVMAPRRVGLAG